MNHVNTTNPDKLISLTIVIPIYNDWNSVSALLTEIDDQCARHDIAATIIMVNDGSAAPPSASFRQQTYQHLQRVRLVNLKRNLGHQRALAVGLYEVHHHVPCDFVAVMDGDGEDRPGDLPLLLEHAKKSPHAFVIAERSKRREGIGFRIGFRIYTVLFRLLTGHLVQGGNFSVFPASMLTRLLTISEIWNHYAAAIIHAQIPTQRVACERGRRYHGTSKMNLPQLIIHGLSAISIFADVVGVRIILFCFTLMLVTSGGIMTTIAIRLFTTLGIPGWATYTTGLLAIILLQSLLITLIFCFIILNNRNTTAFMPLRDAGFFIDTTEDWFIR